jgi:pyrroloquinoline quinone biosynthesis protein E
VVEGRLIEPIEGIHLHEAGRLSRWGVVDVGLKCVHQCHFCYYSFLNGEEDQFAGMRKADFHSTDHIKRLASSLKANGFLGFDVTGGEPCLHPGIVELVAHARKVGLAPRIITLGQYLKRKMKSAPGYPTLLAGLLDAGVADFLLSVHAVDEENFKAITGESWRQLLAAMTDLDAGFDFGTNTTVCEENFRLLPDIAREIATHRVYVANLIIMNAYYAWSRPGGRATEVQAHYSEVRPYVVEARDILEAAGIAVNVRYAPLCTMRGLERNLVGVVGVRHDPHEWMNTIDHMAKPGASDPEAMGQRIQLRDHETHYPLAFSREYVAIRGAGKVFPEKCRSCRAISVCDGVDGNYHARRGDSELEPYADFRGDLLDRERLRYRAAHVVKLEPFAEVKATVKSLLGESQT